MLPVSTGRAYVKTGVQHDTRVHGPCTRAVNTARAHGYWTVLYTTELYDGRSLASASRGPAVDMLTGGNKNMPRYSQQFSEGKVEREDSAHGDKKRRWV